MPASGFVLPRNGRVQIISNDGTDAVQGTFSTTSEGGVVQTFGDRALRITYRGGDGNDVELYDSAVGRFAVGAGAGAGPQVRVFAADGSLASSFEAYAASFRGGVRVATGDVNGDGSRTWSQRRGRAAGRTSGSSTAGPGP